MLQNLKTRELVAEIRYIFEILRLEISTLDSLCYLILAIDYISTNYHK